MVLETIFAATGVGQSARGRAGKQCPNPALPRHRCSVWTGTVPHRGGAFLRRTTAWGFLYDPPPFFRWPKFLGKSRVFT